MLTTKVPPKIARPCRLADGLPDGDVPRTRIVQPGVTETVAISRPDVAAR